MSDPFSLFYVFIKWIPEYVLWLVLHSNNSKQDQILLVEIYILFTLTQISDKQCFQKKKKPGTSFKTYSPPKNDVHIHPLKNIYLITKIIFHNTYTF